MVLSSHKASKLRKSSPHPFFLLLYFGEIIFIGPVTSAKKTLFARRVANYIPECCFTNYEVTKS